MSDDAVTDAIQASIANIPSDDAPATEPVAAEPVVEVAADGAEIGAIADPTKPAEKTPEQVEEDEIAAAEAEIVAKTPGIAKGKISTSRHQAVLSRFKNKSAAELQALTDKYKPFESPETAERLKVAELLEGNPEKVFEYALAHPRYAPVLEKVLAARSASAAAPKVEPKVEPAAAAPVLPDVPKAMPEPDDVDPVSGTVRYSPEGQRNLARWEASQMMQPLLQQITALQDSLKPITSEREALRTFTERQTKMTEQLTTARDTWMGFKEHEPAIREHWNANPKVNLYDAYIAVVPGAMAKAAEAQKPDMAKLEADLRKKINDELNAAARGTRPKVPVNGLPPAGITVDPDSDPTTDAIRASIRNIQ